MRLPETVVKVYVVCKAESSEECYGCPFFKLPEDRFVCRDDYEGILEEVSNDIEEEQASEGDLCDSRRSC
ncbi:hypothetical protein DRO29_05095 [Candidatus Bathyarchaeota archaeon]|nr:MAG: hypothetical protein DRO29_05095 [Candidatus Bathyarchaeota archaeon]